jgi:ATP-dependent DNA helicase RecG
MTPLELGRRLRIVAGAEEMPKPLNVGLLFFNPHPENFFRYAWIEVVDKPDPTGQGMSEKYFKGPLHIQLRSALDYIRNYVLKEKVFKVSGRAEAERHWNYPYDAVEEALVNAVYHKSYRKPEPIVVTFTREQMTITSIPGPDRSIKMADIKRLCLVSKGDRNRRIGEFLKELDLAEARNTGYPVILGATKTNGSPKPILETNTHRDYFTFVLPIHEMFLKSDAETVRELNMADSVKGVNEGVNKGVNGGVKILLAVIRKNPGKRTNELALLIGKSVQTVERYVKELKAAGEVEFRGAPKNGGYFIIDNEGR